MVVLDGYTLNPGDLSWQALEELGELIVYDRTAPDQVLERSKGAAILLTNKTPLPGSVLEQLPDLKMVSVLATGYNIVDIETAKRLSIPVCNVPGYSTHSVAQLCFALLLELTHAVKEHNDAVKSGAWVSSPDFSFWTQPLTELAGKTFGIIGLGDIGKKVADIAAAFDMKVLAYSRTKTDQSPRQNFAWASLEELLQKSDVVSLHCPLTPQTEGLINAERLKLMKPSAYLINTSRGPLIVEQDLADALNNNQLAGAALDVLSKEPPPPNNPLLTAKHCLITPHIAWASVEARKRLMQATVENLHSFMKGSPINKVN